MKRLRSLLPRASQLRWVLLALLLGPFLVLGMVLLVALAIGSEVYIDPAKVLLSVAIVVLSVAAWQVARYRMRPKQRVTVNHNFKLVQPALPFGRYSFRLEVFYEVEQKGDRHTVQQGVVELKFRKNDHPEIFEWCRLQISEQLVRHQELAAARYPDAEVQLGPTPTIPELEQRVVDE